MSEKAMLYIMKRMEARLQDLMSAEEYQRFSREVAREAFLMDVIDMANGSFKDFALEHFDEIVKEADDAAN